MKKFRIMFACALLSISSFAAVERGYFEVSARNPFGVPFNNKHDAPIVINLAPSGQWGYLPGTRVGATGDATDPCYYYGVCPIGWAPAGALVVRQRGEFSYIGAGIDLAIQPGETVYFLMNDAGAAFGDNSGSLGIHWYCVDGCDELADGLFDGIFPPDLWPTK